jgi:NAD(P)-dependent dehydrogenase (short-subunit alcohol dehydrogenase family)
MSQRLEGKIALITGGNSGIGLATAQRFAEEGAYVFITGRRQAELDEAVKLIGPNAFGVQGDVSKLADLDRLYAPSRANSPDPALAKRTSIRKARKIRVNALSPGPIATPGIEQLTGSKEGIAQWEASMSAAVPLGRVGEADEIAKAAVFLASDDSSFVTGIELFVDGGMAQI